jgi:preprotein translocase subunit SecD
MKSLSKIRLILIVASVIISIVYAIPNFVNTSKKDQSFNFLPGKKINLGLDLQGGSYLLLKADMDVVFAEKLDTLLSDIRSSLRKSKIGYKKLNIQNDIISFQKRKNYSNEKIKKIIFALNKNLILENEFDTFFIKF